MCDICRTKVMLAAGMTSHEVIEWLLQRIADIDDDVRMFSITLDHLPENDELRERTSELREYALETKATAEKLISQLCS